MQLLVLKKQRRSRAKAGAGNKIIMSLNDLVKVIFNDYIVARQSQLKKLEHDFRFRKSVGRV